MTINLNTLDSAILEKWVPYSQQYLFNAIPDTNHNANPTNANHYSKVTLTLLTILDTVVNTAFSRIALLDR